MDSKYLQENKYSLCFSGSFGVVAWLGVGLRAGVLPSPPGVSAFPSSFALLGLHTTNVTTPSVFFNKDAAYRYKMNAYEVVLLWQSERR